MGDNLIKITLRNEAEEEIVMEAVMNREYATSLNTGRIETYFDKVKLCYLGSGYKRYGKYWVKETFEGDRTLTELLTEYIERTASLKY